MSCQCALSSGQSGGSFLISSVPTPHILVSVINYMVTLLVRILGKNSFNRNEISLLKVEKFVGQKARSKSLTAKRRGVKDTG